MFAADVELAVGILREAGHPQERLVERGVAALGLVGDLVLADAVAGRAEVGHDVVALVVERADDDDAVRLVAGVEQAGVLRGKVGGGLSLGGRLVVRGGRIGARADIADLGMEPGGGQHGKRAGQAQRDEEDGRGSFHRPDP